MRWMMHYAVILDDYPPPPKQIVPFFKDFNTEQSRLSTKEFQPIVSL